MSAPARPIDRWFASYSDDHRNATNQWIHVACVPAILWSVIALLWCIPVPGGMFRQGLWAALAMFLALMFYYRASRPLGFGMLARDVDGVGGCTVHKRAARSNDATPDAEPQPTKRQCRHGGPPDTQSFPRLGQRASGTTR